MTTAFDLVGTVLNRHNDPFKALLKLRESVPIGEVWRELLSRPDYLATIAENSYRHDNGFDKIVLVGSPTSQLKLVLHVWRAGSDRHKDNIHNHRWDFASILLSGSLQLDFYAPDPTGRVYQAMRYSLEGESRRQRLDPAGDLAVVRHASILMTQGSTYRWGMTPLHRAWAADDPLTCTLIVQGPPQRDHTTVLIRSTDGRRGSRLQAPLNTGDLKGIMVELATHQTGDTWPLG